MENDETQELRDYVICFANGDLYNIRQVRPGSSGNKLLNSEGKVVFGFLSENVNFICHEDDYLKHVSHR